MRCRRLGHTRTFIKYWRERGLKDGFAAFRQLKELQHGELKGVDRYGNQVRDTQAAIARGAVTKTACQRKRASCSYSAIHQHKRCAVLNLTVCALPLLLLLLSVLGVCRARSRSPPLGCLPFAQARRRIRSASGVAWMASPRSLLSMRRCNCAKLRIALRCRSLCTLCLPALSCR